MKLIVSAEIDIQFASDNGAVLATSNQVPGLYIYLDKQPEFVVPNILRTAIIRLFADNRSLSVTVAPVSPMEAAPY